MVRIYVPQHTSELVNTHHGPVIFDADHIAECTTEQAMDFAFHPGFAQLSDSGGTAAYHVEIDEPDVPVEVTVVEVPVETEPSEIADPTGPTANAPARTRTRKRRKR
jgi:hypothetical protein